MRYIEQNFRHTIGINLILNVIIIYIIIMAHPIWLLMLERHNKTISYDNVLIRGIHLCSTSAKQ